MIKGTIAKISVVLAADCYVGGKLRTKGETVEVAEEIAAGFAEKPETVPEEIKPSKVRRSKKKQ